MFLFQSNAANESHPKFHDVLLFKNTKMSCLPLSRRVELVCAWYYDGQFKDDGGKLNNNILTDGMPSFIDSPFSHNHQRHKEGQV